MGSAITIVKEFLSAVSWMTSVATHRAPSPFARDMGELSRSTEKFYGVWRRKAARSADTLGVVSELNKNMSSFAIIFLPY